MTTEAKIEVRRIVGPHRGLGDTIERHLESKKNNPPAEGGPHEYESI